VSKSNNPHDLNIVFHFLGSFVHLMNLFRLKSKIIIPPMKQPPAFGYQQQLVPGMRPGGAPPFFVPMVQQGQQGQRPGGRRGAGPVQQPQQSVPIMQQQVFAYI
jgi:hypothetical protein